MINTARPLLVTIALLCLYATAEAQVLRTIEIQHVPDNERGAWINQDPDRAILVVYSDIEKMTFQTNHGGIVDVDNPNRGIYRVWLMPGTHQITYSAENFQSVKDRIHIKAKDVGEVRVKVLNAGATGGRGDIRIETVPLGASVVFNNIALPDKTPVTIENQPAGRQPVKLKLEGYTAIDTVLVVEKDKTVTHKIHMQKEYAGLKVTSDPSGATVFLDGDRLGMTPLEKNDLTPGEGMLTVEKDGYVTNSQIVRLKVGDNPPVNVYLAIQTGSISITTIPSGAEVFLDNESIGVYNGTPIVRNKLSIGSHTARVRMEGYNDASQTIDVTFNTTSTVQLSLQGKPGALFVTTTPSGASIYLDGVDTDKKTSAKISDLSSGQHKLGLRLSGYNDIVKTVIVLPGKTETINETLDVGLDKTGLADATLEETPQQNLNESAAKQSQSSEIEGSLLRKKSIGLGIGIPYGYVLGLNLDINVAPNLNLSAGLGTTIQFGPGYNFGLKYFLTSAENTFRPRVSAFYGVNFMFWAERSGGGA
ncbi:MAG: PEGA domain-containing protein [Calditrichaeota bacterium]|nr:PEGA domain-containing protein [Calditrichota bacterium]